MYRRHTIAVVVPAYRESAILRRMLGRVPGWVDHVVVVDDGSPDATFDVAADVAERDVRVEVARLGFNQGVGRAISHGYRRARAAGADVVAVMAGDDQMDPDDLPALLDPIVEGAADYVKGNRLVHAEARKMPPVRRLGSRVLARLTGLAAGTGLDVDDSQCGYTAIAADVVDRLPLSRLYPRYGYPNDLLLRLAERDVRVAEVPVRPVYADEVSGFRPTQVVVPITGILLRGVARRALRRS